MKRLIVVKIEMLKNINRYQLLKTKHASVEALVYPSNLVEIYQTTVCRRGRGGRVCKPNIITTPVFKELQKQRLVWRDLNNLLSPCRETRLFFFCSTTKWHAVSSIPSSLSAVKPVKHIKAHCSANTTVNTLQVVKLFSVLISSSDGCDVHQHKLADLITWLCL